MPTIGLRIPVANPSWPMTLRNKLIMIRVKVPEGDDIRIQDGVGSPGG